MWLYIWRLFEDFLRNPKPFWELLRTFWEFQNLSEHFWGLAETLEAHSEDFQNPFHWLYKDFLITFRILFEDVLRTFWEIYEDILQRFRDLWFLSMDCWRTFRGISKDFLRTLWQISQDFSPNRSTGPLRSSSRNVHTSVCLSVLNFFLALFSSADCRLWTSSEFSVSLIRNMKRSITCNLLMKKNFGALFLWSEFWRGPMSWWRTKYWSYSSHQLRDVVFPVCRNFKKLVRTFCWLKKKNS